MNLELKGEEKSGFDDRQHKMNRNFPKEEEHNKGKKKKINKELKRKQTTASFEEVRNMIMRCNMQYQNQKPGHFTK